jgi:DNA-binding protein Fis
MRELPTLWDLERILMEEAIQRYWTKTEAAQAVGLTREGYRRKLIRMGLDY